MLIHKSLPVPEWISSGLGFLCPKEGTSGLPSRQPGQSRVVFSEQAGRVLGAGGGLEPLRSPSMQGRYLYCIFTVNKLINDNKGKIKESTLSI